MALNNPTPANVKIISNVLEYKNAKNTLGAVINVSKIDSIEINGGTTVTIYVGSKYYGFTYAPGNTEINDFYNAIKNAMLGKEFPSTFSPHQLEMINNDAVSQASITMSIHDPVKTTETMTSTAHLDSGSQPSK